MEYIETDVVVIGAGPGGYAAAFYAADRGKNVILIEKDQKLGGVCLNRGCIPSKALLHASLMVKEARDAERMGISYERPAIDFTTLRNWKNDIINKLSEGVRTLCEKRNVTLMKGRGSFDSSDVLRVETDEGQQFIKFKDAIIAVGSEAAMPKAFDLGNPRIMTSTEALEIEDIPGDLLIVGGGYIGMELGTVYSSFGSDVVMVEAMSQILTGADNDLLRPIKRYAENNFKEVRVNTKVSQMETEGQKVKVTMTVGEEQIVELYDRVLVAVGRQPNCKDIGLENTKVELDDRGFIRTNLKRQTGDPHIYAIGDIAGGALLAHKAAKEGRVAVEAICGEKVAFEHVVIPAVVFTDPELAWCGLTELEAKEQKIKVKVVRFPWSASGRALTLDRPEGLTKLILDPETERILGVGIVGYGAGDLISEGTLAVEMVATAKDLAEVVHPHPTLSETIMESAESFYGTATHTLSSKRA